VAVALYDEDVGHLPSVPALGGNAAGPASSPLKALMVELGLSDFRELTDASHPPPKRGGAIPQERRVAGLTCASDPNAAAADFPAPVSYRAATGDAPEGGNGAFAPGRRIGIAQIEATDGSSYTAAFAERLLGDGRRDHPAASNYALAAGMTPGTSCPPAPLAAWRGDAGASWVASDWQSALYNHALRPGVGPSCIAGSGGWAFMGASSGHAAGVNVLFFDGTVRTFTLTIEPRIWREWATVPEAPRAPP
jgi:prepilin-type processing-associated H-X9-DG protein